MHAADDAAFGVVGRALQQRGGLVRRNPASTSAVVQP
jgi:hypothetical protein